MWTCYTFTEDSHNIRNFMLYSLVCGFFNVPRNCEHSRVVRRRREDLRFRFRFRCNYKGSTFSSVILRPWVLVRPESNSRPPAGANRCSTNWATGTRFHGDPKGLVCTKMAKKRYKAFKTNICSLKEAESEDQWVARTNAWQWVPFQQFPAVFW